jgi:hypothetical protein
VVFYIWDFEIEKGVKGFKNLDTMLTLFTTKCAKFIFRAHGVIKKLPTMQRENSIKKMHKDKKKKRYLITKNQNSKSFSISVL